MLLLTGCAGTNGTAPFKAGDSPAAVRLPQACEPFLKPVPAPPVAAQTDARIAFTRTADALDTANGRLTAGGRCVRDQRSAYAAKKD